MTAQSCLFLCVCVRWVYDYSISSPNAFIPLVSTVLGYSPEPHSLNEPKSLYHGPSGARGPDLTHSCRRLRSASVTSRS